MANFSGNFSELNAICCQTSCYYNFPIFNLEIKGQALLNNKKCRFLTQINAKITSLNQDKSFQRPNMLNNFTL